MTQIDYVPLRVLATAFHPANPKSHDIDDIKASIRRHGFVEPGVVDDFSGLLGSGHGRTEALVEMHADGEPVPRNIEVDATGDWLVPVLRGALASTSEADAKAYLVGANQTTIGGGWEDDKLAAILVELRDTDGLDGTGFVSVDIDHLLASLGTPSDDGPAPDQTDRLVTRLSVVVDVPDDRSQRALIERLGKEGYPCRALNS